MSMLNRFQNELTPRPRLDWLPEHKPDAIFTFSGSIVPNFAKPGEYKPITFAFSDAQSQDPDDLGHDKTTGANFTGGKVRARATGLLLDYYGDDVPIVVNAGYEPINKNPYRETLHGGLTEKERGVETMAEAYARELGRMGVSAANITKEENSFSTLTQFIELLKISIENDYKNVFVPLNKYYIPRAGLMWDSLDKIVSLHPDDQWVGDLYRKFKEDGGQVTLIDADRLMVDTHAQYGRYFDKVYASEQYKAFQIGEQKGISALQEHPEKYNYASIESIKPAPDSVLWEKISR